MRGNFKIGIISGAIVSLCAFYMWGIPAIVNLPSHKDLIESKIFENSSYKIDIGNPNLSMGTFPSVWIKSDNISVLNHDNSKALSIDNPKLKIKLLPLIRKKIEITDLSADREIANFVYSKDSKFLLGQYPIEAPKSQSNFTLSKVILNLGEYNILLDDQKNGEKLSLRGNYFKHGKYIRNRQIRFATDSIFTTGKKSTEISVDLDINLPINKLTEDKFRIYADVKDFDLSSVSNYISTLTNGKINKLGGILNINADTSDDNFNHKKVSLNLNTKNLEIIGKDKASSVIFNDKLIANLDFGTIENGINIQNFILESKNIHAFANGKLYNLGAKEPKYDINAEVKKTRIEDVVAILPGSESLLADFNLYKLKKYVFYGDGEGKLNFKGQGIRPNVTGEINLTNAYLIHTIRGAKENATINLKFIGQKMLVDVFVPAGIDQSVRVTGNALLDGSKYSELNIESTKAVPLAPAREILVPLHEILKFQLGPVPLMQISGFGNIAVRSAGRKVDPHIWGIFNFYDATASLNDVKNLEILNGAGEVKFDDTLVTFKTYHATLNSRPIEIKGDCVMLGKLNVYVTSKGQDIKKLISSINQSPILAEVQNAVKPFTHPDGIADVALHIYGIAKDAETMVFNQDLFAKGTVTLHNAKTTIKDTFLPFTKINGVVNFDQYNSDYNLTGYVRNSKVHVKGTGTNYLIDLKADSDNFEISDVFDILHPNMKLPYKNEIGHLHTAFNAGYKGAVQGNSIDYNKIEVDGRFIPNMSSQNPIKINGGTFTIANGYLKTSPLNGLLYSNPFNLTFTAKDLDKKLMTIADARFNFKNFDISSANLIKQQLEFPKDTENLISNISDLKGNIDISGNIKNNQVNADTNLKNLSFVYKPYETVVTILNGKANIRGNVLYLDRINSKVSSMPVFLNGRISNIYQNPNLNLFVSSKLTQQFFDLFFNSKSVYPVKTKGDINFYTRLNGTLNALNARSNLNIGENSSIYYMGATLAGAPTGNTNSDEITTNPVSIVSDVILYPERLKVNSFNYNQTITSQNKKKSEQTQLIASGDILLLKNNILGFRDFKIKTLNPTNARIFNVLFKRPTIKQGVFSSDLKINGTSNAPYILGSLDIKSIDIPILDSTIRDINVDFQKDYINLAAKGIILTNDLLVQAKIVNKTTKPLVVEDVNVQMDELDLNIIANALSELEADTTRNTKIKNSDSVQVLTPYAVVIKNAQVNADNILIKKARATDFKSHLTLDSSQILNIDNYQFDIANGKVDGSIRYDLKDYKGIADMNIENADAQIIAENFFDMTGQVYGTVSGKLNAACTGISSIDCVNTLSGEGDFKVIDGRMPKLGSLEYLLKAGNLVTGGITAISINSIIDLITPLKTGNFNSITGDIHVKNGIADDINVYSDGRDLNMYMTGSYNLSTLVADMEIYGSLSKNFSTLLGRIANSSLNTLFNTIPGININEINPTSTSKINKIPNFDKSNILRVFRAEIYGDINGNNYVKSFRWIKD